MGTLEFGDCLSRILALRGWSAVRLAKGLNVDSSYVRKWMSGERVPALNSQFVSLIASEISEGLDRVRAKSISEAMESDIGGILTGQDGQGDVREGIREILLKSQIHTLGLEKGKRSRKRHLKTNMIDILDGSIALADDPLLHPVTGPEANMIINPPAAVVDKVGILKAAIAILNDALGDDLDVGREILLTFQSERGCFADYPDLYGQYRNAISQALSRGWVVKQLCRLNRNIERSVSLVTDLMEWVGYAGSYQLFYFNKYGLARPPMEVFAVEGKGALLCFATKSNEDVDSALVFRSPEATGLICAHFHRMLLTAEPMVEVLDREQVFELNPAKDRKFGRHLIFSKDLSFLTIPMGVLEKYMRRSIPDPIEYRKHHGRVKDCLESFDRDVRTCDIRHIIPMKAVEHLVNTGGYYSRNPYYVPHIQDIVSHLRNVVHLLRTYDNFMIALIGENQMHLVNQTEWDIKGDHTLVLSIMPKSDMLTVPVQLAITEGTLISAFQEAFMDIWDRINPANKEKGFVISWFEGMLRRLEGSESFSYQDK